MTPVPTEDMFYRINPEIVLDGWRVVFVEIHHRDARGAAWLKDLKGFSL